LPAVEQDSRREIVGTPTEENRLSGLRCAGIVQSLCHRRADCRQVEQRDFAALHALKSWSTD